MNTIIPLLALSLCSALLAAPPSQGSASKPNIVLIFTDDQGYGDLSLFGATHVSTPRIDQMAAEGLKLTSFYVAAPVCSPSRAALMTGCYPKRIDMATGSNFGVLLAADTKGLNPDEITIAETLKERGYATAIIGKWHLGDKPEFLPTRQGFDQYYGIPYSNDMGGRKPEDARPPLPLMRNEEVIEAPADQASPTSGLRLEGAQLTTSGQNLFKSDRRQIGREFLRETMQLCS